MADLIAPHGGTLVNRFVPDAEIASFKKNMPCTTAIPVSDADLSTLYRIADGGLSPLTGPMTESDYLSVLDSEFIERDGRKLAWTIPLSLPVNADLGNQLDSGKYNATHPLKNERDEVVGVLTVKSVFEWDKVKYNTAVYGTPRTDHPGARIANNDPRTHLVGGDITMLPPPRNPHFGDLVLSPRETRDLFAKIGYQRVVGFQTRNALHRAHEYALVVGLERLTKAGFFAGAVLNPLVGETKSDDVDAVTRMKTYRALIANKAIGEGDSDDEL